MREECWIIRLTLGRIDSFVGAELFSFKIYRRERRVIRDTCANGILTLENLNTVLIGRSTLACLQRSTSFVLRMEDMKSQELTASI